jgi:hypothetical protein
MSIIVVRPGMSAHRIERTVIQHESYLQQYIDEHPDTLPFDQLKPDAKILVLLREFPTVSGPVDAFAVDADGDVYLIETKLYKNPDKRLVLAQVLDYGAAIWRTYRDPEQFVERIDELLTARAQRTLADRVQTFYGFSGSTLTQFLSNLTQNVIEGRFRFVVLMDQVDERLKDLIAYVNANSAFEILGVALDFYDDGDIHILIPTLHGAEAKRQAVTSSSSGRRRWDEPAFFADAGTRLTPEQLAAVRRLHEWAAEHADEVRYGTGTQTGSFNAVFTRIHVRAVFTVNSNGALTLNFKWLTSTPDAEAWAERFEAELRRIQWLPIPADFKGKFVSFGVAEWTPQVGEFIDVVARLTS